MVELAVGAAALGGGESLFSYNRENFMFDKEIGMVRDFQAFGMDIKQQELHREDVEDIISLTVRKMDNYLIVNTLQLGFCMTLFIEGRPEPDENNPDWLITLFAISNVGSFMYYLISIWLAIHASVAAHAFGVRMKTQYVRLPIPSPATIEKSAGLAQHFEGAKTQDMFRIPVMKKQLERLNRFMTSRTTDDMGADARSDVASSDGVSADASDDLNPTAFLHHIQLIRKLQANWQSFDAYARVCMAMGTNQLLQTLSYMSLCSLASENNVPWPAFCCVVIFTTGGWTLAKLDLALSPNILRGAFVLLVSPPCLVLASLYLHQNMDFLGSFSGLGLDRWFVPIAYALHFVWIVYATLYSKALDFGNVYLPTHFRSVLFIDVFGWMSEEQPGTSSEGDRQGEDRSSTQTSSSRRGPLGMSPIPEDAEGPSSSSSRPRDTSSAQASTLPRAVEGRSQQAEHGMFQPSRLVRRDADEPARHKPGFMPWSTVRNGSVLLAVIWFCSFIWAIVFFSLRGAHQPSTRHPSLKAHESTLHLLTPDLIEPQGWRHAFSKPVAVACNSNLDDILFVAERYAVRAVSLGAASSSELSRLQDRLESCLRTSGNFQGQGLRGLRIFCEPDTAKNRSCAAVMLGADGHEVLRCPLEQNKAAERIRLLGGPWQDVAPVSSQEIWGLRVLQQGLHQNRSAIVQLRLQSSRAKGYYFPQSDLHLEDEDHGRLTSLLHLDGTAGGLLVGLAQTPEASKAWPLISDAAEQLRVKTRWKLRGGEMVLSSCDSGDGLYFLSGAGSRASLWRSHAVA